jgi:catechol 2,3-dioxygenase-like lactoylglutathione lyase family enzyme
MSDPKPPAEGVNVGGFLREPPPETEGSRDRGERPTRETDGHVPARTSFATLAVRDMPMMTRFYRQFRWPESKHSDESFVAFQTGGAVLGLYPASNYEKELGAAPPPGVFKGFVLAINLEDAARVDQAYATMKRFDDIRLLGEPQDLSFGGRGFSFLDPEGNAWEVVWAEGTSFDERGGLIFP